MPGITTLHEEIAAILAESDEEWMTTSSIASRVNARGRYKKGDGSPVTSYQAHGRTKNYPKLFERDGSRVRLRVTSESAAAAPTPPRVTSRGAVDDLVASAVDDLVASAVEALSRPGRRADDALSIAPPDPGLYAVTATPDGRADLGFDDSVSFLYVGKAEDSLAARDLEQHFASGQTGRSTLRRSLAALLVDDLDLAAMPRNPRNPRHFDRYALEPASDRRLTEWMRSQLLLSYWPAPHGTVLRPVEIAVIERFSPALNLTDVVTPYSAHLRAQRKLLAAQARSWAERQQ